MKKGRKKYGIMLVIPLAAILLCVTVSSAQECINDSLTAHGGYEVDLGSYHPYIHTTGTTTVHTLTVSETARSVLSMIKHIVEGTHAKHDVNTSKQHDLTVDDHDQIIENFSGVHGNNNHVNIYVGNEFNTTGHERHETTKYHSPVHTYDHPNDTDPNTHGYLKTRILSLLKILRHIFDVLDCFFGHGFP